MHTVCLFVSDEFFNIYEEEPIKKWTDLESVLNVTIPFIYTNFTAVPNANNLDERSI